ncbi:MAG: GTPase [Candidatus Atribacteria bacterium]|nr:GTPase [Candidatus Atribacteria bacterium]
MVFRSGFVTIWGQPNVGKSTFLNHVLERKVAIVSSKPQTTRQVIKGILNLSDAQIVFLDTPGLHSPRDEFSRWMVREAERALVGVDVLLYMIAPHNREEEDKKYLDNLRSFSNPVFLVLNKKDLLKEEEVQKILSRFSHLFPFQGKAAVSSLTGEGIPELLSEIVELLPPGSPYYDVDVISDALERDIAAEIIREKIWWYAYQEVPYGVEVRVEEFKDRGEILYIKALIYVERDSHKKIIIGKEGKMLKKIGEEARKEIEFNWGKKVYLDLWVKVEKNWRKRPEVLGRWGYKFK